MGLSAIGALYLASRFGVIARIGSIGLFATAAMLVVRCGSRGGLLSFGVAAATYTITSKTRIANRVLLIAAVSTVTAAALVYTQAGQQAVEVFGGRIIEQTVENRYLSGRDELWFMSLDMTREQPIMGWGLNGFRAMSTFYPHNIFLEVMVEGGSIGLLLLLNAGWAWWRNFRRHRHLISRFDLAALALLFTAAQTSGDLYDSRGIFLVLALSLPAAQLIQRRPSRQSGTVPVRRKPAAALAPAMPSVTNHKPRERRA
jgi:O-antigen ligase